MSITEIGYWSEIKLDIIKKYAAAYSTIITQQKKLSLDHVYIDAFAGAGYHISKESGDIVWGSPLNALLIIPPFKEYHFIDLDQAKTDILEKAVQNNTTASYNPDKVYIYHADCNKVLTKEVFPLVRYKDYRRGLCLLDPYGLHLDWNVIYTAGQMKSIEIFLNFPVFDMNRNVLLKDKSKATQTQIERLNRFWGDDSWQKVAYSTEENLFGWEEKTNNKTLANGFRKRLKEIANFAYVPEPIPMRNKNGAIIYYLFFASQNPVAAKIVTDIFDKYRNYHLK